jgi:hypothetical protein
LQFSLEPLSFPFLVTSSISWSNFIHGIAYSQSAFYDLTRAPLLETLSPSLYAQAFDWMHLQSIFADSGLSGMTMAFLPPRLMQQQPYKPTCTHLTMTRIYDTDSKCSSCHEPGQFGWLYQCTQDHEKMIEEKLVRGLPLNRNIW